MTSDYKQRQAEARAKLRGRNIWPRVAGTLDNRELAREAALRILRRRQRGTVAEPDPNAGD